MVPSPEEQCKDIGLPKPKPAAQDLASVVLGVMGDFLPFGSTLSELWKIQLRKQLEKGQKILIREVASKGISVLRSEDLEYFVPASYRFFEQVRIGEYEHNLEILAALISGDLKRDFRDSGKIHRAANALEGMDLRSLKALAICPEVFRVYEESEMFNDGVSAVSALDFSVITASTSESIEQMEAVALMHDLATRGFLTIMKRPNMLNGIYHSRTLLFEEVIQEAMTYTKNRSSD